MQGTAKRVVARSLRAQESQSRLQQDEIVARCNTRLAVWLLGLPPSAADVGYFENVVLLEADFVCVVGVRFVAVDGLGAVGVLDRGVLLGLVVGGWGCDVGVDAGKLGYRRVASLGASCGTAGVARYRRGRLEAVELGRGVHLRGLVVELRLWAVQVGVGDGARRAGARVLLVQGVRVDKGAVGGVRLGAIVEDPDNLRGVSGRVATEGGGGRLTATMDSRM